MKKILVLFAAIAMLAACKSTKNVETTSKPATVKVEEPAKSAKKSLQAKLDININAGGRSFSVDGKLQMRTDEVIRIIITPMGIMEVGRLELTPNYILIVNKWDKEYVKVSYDELAALNVRGLTFNAIQDQLLTQTFIPGKTIDVPLDLTKQGMGKINLSFVVGKVTEDASFESNTSIGNAYRQVSAQEIMGKLMNM